MEGPSDNFDCQKWAPWTSKKVSKGGAWENNATGVEKGQNGVAHMKAACARKY